MKNSKFKLFLVFVLSFIFLLLNSRNVKASSLSLRVSPPVIKIQTKAPAGIETALKIENITQQTIEVEIVLKPFEGQNDTGQVSYLSETRGFSKKPNPSFLDKVEILDNGSATKHLTLYPFQVKDLKLSIRIPAEESVSDYYFSILYVSNPTQVTTEALLEETDIKEEKNTSIQTQLGIGQHVLLSIRDRISPSKASIESFSSPIFSQYGPIPFTIKVKNSADYYIEPEGVITIKNMFNQTVGNVDIPSTAVLAKSTRTLPSVSWQNGFLLGPYTASLTLSMANPSTSENTYQQTVRFFVIPLKQIGEVGIIVILVVFIKKRIKRHQ